MSSIFLSGGNHWDERWVIRQDLIAGDSVPVQSYRTPGGAAANMARTLESEGHGCTFASVYGDEVPPVQGELVTQIPGASSARYVSLENKKGEVLHGFADMEIY